MKTEKNIIAYDIEWDTDGEAVDLPNEIPIPDAIADDEDEISDYISDETGFCHYGFKLKSGKSLKERLSELENLVSEGAELELDYNAEQKLWYAMNYFPGHAENIIGKDGKFVTAFEQNSYLENESYEEVVKALDEMNIAYVGK